MGVRNRHTVVTKWREIYCNQKLQRTVVREKEKEKQEEEEK